MSNDHPTAAGPAVAAPPCLLCHGRATQLLERIDTGELSAAYRQQFDIDVTLPVVHIDYCLCPSCDLRFFSPAVTGSQDFYAQLQKIPWYYSAAKQEFGIAAQRVGAADNVLEIGAGRGLFAREIRAASYVGLEFSADAIRWAATDGIRLLPETVEQHAGHARGAYDIACTFQVLEHVADPRAFLQAAVRCLRAGGQLVVSVPAEDSFARFAYQDALNMPPHHVTRWTDQALRSIGPACGLRLLAIIPEPLSRNMRRAYASAHADRLLGRWMGVQPRLLRSCAQRPQLRWLLAALTAVIRNYLSVTRWQARRGHAVVAVFEKA